MTEPDAAPRRPESRGSVRETTPAVIVVTDDLTGATGVGAEAVRRAAVAVTIVSWSRLDGVGHPDILVVDTNSRLLDEDAAAERVASTTAAVIARFGRMAPVHYKRVDTQFRGSIRADVAAWAGELGLPLVIAPAAPGLGISTIGGRQHKDGVLIPRGSGADSTRLESVIELAPRAATAVLDPRDEGFARRLLDEVREGRSVVVDAAGVDDLHRIARAAASARAAGVPLGLVGSYGLLGAWLDQDSPARASTGVLVASDSVRSPTIAQLDRFAREGGTLLALGSRDDEQLVSSAIEAIRRGGDVVIASVDPSQAVDVLSPDPRIAGRMTQMVTAVLTESRPAGVGVLGGELASRLMDALGIDRLEVVAEPWPATPLVRVVGGRTDGLAAVFQSGSQGDDGRILNIMSLLRSCPPANEREPHEEKDRT